jgi:hypothetical protein
VLLPQTAMDSSSASLLFGHNVVHAHRSFNTIDTPRRAWGGREGLVHGIIIIMMSILVPSAQVIYHAMGSIINTQCFLTIGTKLLACRASEHPNAFAPLASHSRYLLSTYITSQPAHD